MKKIIPLLLLALVMCQCNFKSSNEPAKKSLRDQYPEKFTTDYIADRSVDLAEKLCNCDPYNVYSFNNVFTTEYGDLLKQALALPEGIDGDGPSSGLWIEFAGELCSMLAVTDVKVTDNNAKAGDRIRIYASAPANTWQVELFNGHWDGMVERFSAVALTEEDGSPRESSIFDLDALGYFEYTITDTFLTTNTVAQGWGGTFLLNGDGNLTVTKVTLVQGGASGIETIKAVNVKNGAVYNLSGQKVDASYKGVVIKNGKKMLQK